MLVYALVSAHVSVMMCILVWTHVHVCVALPIVMGVWRWKGCYGGFLSINVTVINGDGTTLSYMLTWPGCHHHDLPRNSVSW